MTKFIKTRPALLIELLSSDGTTAELLARISDKTDNQVVLSPQASWFAMLGLRITGHVGAVRKKGYEREYALTEKGEKKATELREFFMRLYNLK
jgi:hypothetical protein